MFQILYKTFLNAKKLTEIWFPGKQSHVQKGNGTPVFLNSQCHNVGDQCRSLHTWQKDYAKWKGDIFARKIVCSFAWLFIGVWQLKK